MATRSLVLAITFSLAAAGPLAGCLDDVLGKGELVVVVRASDTPSYTAGSNTFVNANGEFATAKMLVNLLKIAPKQGEQGDVIEEKRHEPNVFVDLAGNGSQETEVLRVEMLEEEWVGMSLVTVPFTGTLLNGTTTNISVIPRPKLWEYSIGQPFSIEGGETTVYAISFMIARLPGDDSGQGFFLAVPPDESGPR